MADSEEHLPSSFS